MSNETCRLITKAQLDKYNRLEKRNAELVTKIHGLEQQLKEANEVIKYYAYGETEEWVYDEKAQEEYLETYPFVNESQTADDYLEKYGVEK